MTERVAIIIIAVGVLLLLLALAGLIIIAITQGPPLATTPYTRAGLAAGLILIAGPPVLAVRAMQRKRRARAAAASAPRRAQQAAWADGPTALVYTIPDPAQTAVLPAVRPRERAS